MDFAIGLTAGVIGSVIAAFAYEYFKRALKHSPEKALTNISLWKYDGDNLYYANNPDYRVSTTYDDEIFCFYDKTPNGITLKYFDRLKADIGISKEVWDFCNRGNPIIDNVYQVLSAKFCSTSSDSFTVVLIKVTLKHYPKTGDYNHFFIPEKIWQFKSKKELIESKAYKICRLLYLNNNQGEGSCDTYLDCMGWDSHEKV